MGCSSTKTVVSTSKHVVSDHVQKQPDHVQKKPGRVQKTKDSVESEMSEKTSVPVNNSINNEKCSTLNYASVDTHARKAPSVLRNSVQELVAYLTKPSKEPIMIVRAIFVWITENIAYDDDGYFGRSTRASCDAESVMKGGKSVCSGYANVMETLCRAAGVPVKKISGYAKGYSHSDGNPFSTSDKTNHAWNAVQLKDKWYLLDSTWGAGHLDTTQKYNTRFKEFFFMTKPEELIYSHFPYMDSDASGKASYIGSV